MSKAIYSISDLSSEFGITNRSIRFYEEKGLIQPDRTTGNQRRYSPKDRVRLKLILRGKRFGYTLDEIA
jgi:DNA-binding transcriptional MerR regulator